jgi:hypothetical protein
MPEGRGSTISSCIILSIIEEIDGLYPHSNTARKRVLKVIKKVFFISSEELEFFLILY